MATYQLAADAIGGVAYSGVIRTADGKWISCQAVSESPDWAAYLGWLGTAGNVPDPYKSPVGGGAVITLPPDEEPVGSMKASMPDVDYPAVPVSAPEMVDTPVIAGAPEVGQTLTCTWGNWNHEPTGYSGQWMSDGVVQVGTGEDYVVQASDVGHTLTCIVTAANGLGFTEATPADVVFVPDPGMARQHRREPPQEPRREPERPRDPPRDPPRDQPHRDPHRK